LDVKKRFTEEGILGFRREAERRGARKRSVPTARVLGSELLTLTQQVRRTNLETRLIRNGAAGRRAAVLLLIASCLACAAARTDVPRALLQLVADVPLGGNTTRLDYESLDEGRHLLFIAHLGDNAVIVFDTQTQRVVTRIPGISQVHGVLVIPEVGTVYASATGSNEVVAISEETLKVTARAPGGV
jgi:DNA-binding beta-propeller fold protein YncE